MFGFSVPNLKSNNKLFCFLMELAYPPTFSSFIRLLQGMLRVKLPFKKKAMFCESCSEPKNTYKCGVWACVHACGAVWGRGYSAVQFGEWGHIHARGEKKGSAMESSGQWTPARCPGPQLHRQGLPPTILNYAIVLSDSTLPRLVRHHLLSPQKAL